MCTDFLNMLNYKFVNPFIYFSKSMKMKMEYLILFIIGQTESTLWIAALSMCLIMY